MSGYDGQVELRCLTYRLRRMGMLELEVWLQPLLEALKQKRLPDSTVHLLLTYDVAELERMMRGHLSIPEELRTCLS